MKTYYAGGTVGDAYVILCKLYSIAIKEPILCKHYTEYKATKPVIEEIYGLVSNIKVEFLNEAFSGTELCGGFQNLVAEKASYGTEPEYYPEFELGSIERFNLPKTYAVLQTNAGSHGDRSFYITTVEKILAGSRVPVVFIGENIMGLSMESFNAMDLRGKTSIKEVISIVKNSRHFYGFLGLLSFVAVSHKVMSDVYMTSQLDVSAIKIRTEAVEEWRKFLMRK